MRALIKMGYPPDNLYASFDMEGRRALCILKQGDKQLVVEYPLHESITTIEDAECRWIAAANAWNKLGRWDLDAQEDIFRASNVANRSVELSATLAAKGFRHPFLKKTASKDVN